MLWKKKNTPEPKPEATTTAATPTAATVIAENYTLKGRIHGQGPIELKGRMEGHLDIRGRVSISSGASVEGEISAEELEIGGKVEGHLEVTRQLILGPTARFAGSAAAVRIAMAEGACLNGDVRMKA